MSQREDELGQARHECRRREETHRQALRLSFSQRCDLEAALIDERWFLSLTVNDLHILAKRFESFQSAAEAQAFLDAVLEAEAEPNYQPDPAFVWSANTGHIQTLFRPWRPHDGYEEAVIQGGEMWLGHALPEPLRSFYRYWGTREKMVGLHNYLLGPHEIFVLSDVVVFGVENQGVNYWGVRQNDLGQENPPVYWSYDKGPPQGLIWQPSHPHISDFLDTLTYFHAFCGGANYGGLWRGALNKAILARHYQLIEIPTVEMVFAFDGAPEPGWPIYVRDGIAIDRGFTGGVIARSAEDLDEMRRMFGVTWRKRW